MYIKKSSNKANTRSRKIKAEDEVMVEDQVEEGAEDAAVSVDPEATDLLFETEDVAELIAEVTGQDVDVVADENEVVFSVGDEDFTVTAEGDEEILESSKKALRGKKAVRASRKVARRRNRK